MNNIGIFYGSSGGNTKDVAGRIANKLGISAANLHDVSKARAADLAPYEILLFGSATWGLGDLQDDWEGFITTVSSADLSGKKIGIFGCGDSSSYPDTFCNAIGKIYQAVKDKASVAGFTSPDGYTFDDSEAVVNGLFAGLPLDEENESDLTEGRIDSWIEQLKGEFVF
jgi:flavodoxin I